MALDLKAQLTKKMGPLPAWGWLAVGGGIGFYLIWRRKHAAAGAGSSTAGALGTGTGGPPVEFAGGTSSGGTGGTTPAVPITEPVSTSPIPQATPQVTGAPVGTISSPVQTLDQIAASWGLMPGGYFQEPFPGGQLTWVSPNGVLTSFQGNMPPELRNAYALLRDPFTGQPAQVRQTPQTGGSLIPSGQVAAPYQTTQAQIQAMAHSVQPPAGGTFTLQQGPVL